MSFAVTWMDLEVIILGEVSNREKQSMILLKCGTKKMVQMNLFTK